MEEKSQHVVEPGLCHCGCGQKTKINTQTDNRRGWVKSKPRRFISGHHSRINNPNKKEGRVIISGYVVINKNRSTTPYYPYHRDLVESILGRILPSTAVVHHSDGDRLNNVLSNLVVCEDNAYHMLLHRRTRAFHACGNASWLKCKFCKQYDNPTKLYINKVSRGYHRSCMAKYVRERRINENTSASDTSG